MDLERYESEDPDIEREEDGNSSVMDRPFDPTLINIETKTPSLDTLIKRIQRNSIRMNTESYFQRSDDLWDRTKQSRLIESILIRFPLPAFYFDATDDNNWLVVDGLQRLSSIRNFIVLKNQPLTNLEFLPHLNGKYWDDLPENLHRLIEEHEVFIYKIMPGTPTDVKFNIFKRINTGGLVLEPQEIRHALFQGRPADFIAELASMEEFRRATDYRIPTRRMLDRDFANRFLGFYLLGVENYGAKEYGADLDSFMSRAMAAVDEKTETQLMAIKEAFGKAMNLSYQIFGKEAFRKVTNFSDRLPRINKALFDALSTQFALLSDEEAHTLVGHAKEFKLQLAQRLSGDTYFYTSVTTATGDRQRTLYRHEVIKEIIENTITQSTKP